MKRLHVIPVEDEANGVFVVARMLAREDGGRIVEARRVMMEDIRAADEVWVHGMWLPREWRVCRMAIKAGKPLVRMTHGSLSPVYLEHQSKWKKRLVSPIERYFYSKTSRVVVTCEAEAEWCRAWGVKCPIEVLDLKRFFNFSRGERIDPRIARITRISVSSGEGLTQRLKGTEAQRSTLHVLYLGRRHPLKGVECLEKAVEDINQHSQSEDVSAPLRLCVKTKIELRIVSDAFGEEKEKVWDWCDVLVLPTLSENFGLVVAEALERGKRVITTDGAPAWSAAAPHGERGMGNGDWMARLTYLRGFRDGTDEQRIALLKEALVTYFV